MSSSLNCLLDRPDPSEIAERIKTDISINILGGSPIPPGSNEDVLAYTIGGAIFELWGARDQLWNEINPETMCCDNLVKYAARRGIYPQEATSSCGYVQINGTAGTSIPSNITFTDTNGNLYTASPEETPPSSIPDTGSVNIKIVSVLPGEFNVTGTLTTESVITGIDSAAAILGTLSGGSVEEDCDLLRSRILSSLKSGPVCGTAGWYEEKVLAYPGITRACVGKCCSECCSSSGITVYAFGDEVWADNYGIPDKTLLDQISEDIFGQYAGAGHGMAPVGVYGSVTCATPSILTIRVSGVSVSGSEIEEAIASAFQDFFNQGFCPGDNFCKSTFINIVGSIIGSQNCVSDVEFIVDENATVDGNNVFFNCGYFPALEDVIFNC